MIDHPKFTLVATNDFYSPFKILEHTSAIDPADGKEKVMSQPVATFKRIEEAFLDLALRSGGNVVIAYSTNPIDNTFSV